MAKQTTDDLYQVLNQMQNVDELHAYLATLRRDAEAESLSCYLNNIIHAKKLALRDVVAASGLELHYAYQIINGNRVNPSRTKIIALCVACHMTVDEAQHALEISQQGILYPRNIFDSIIIFHLNHENWSIYAINEKLHAEGLPIIE